jgi:hypothetical protein
MTQSSQFDRSNLLSHSSRQIISNRWQTIALLNQRPSSIIVNFVQRDSKSSAESNVDHSADSEQNRIELIVVVGLAVIVAIAAISGVVYAIARWRPQEKSSYLEEKGREHEFSGIACFFTSLPSMEAEIGTFLNPSTVEPTVESAHVWTDHSSGQPE